MTLEEVRYRDAVLPLLSLVLTITPHSSWISCYTSYLSAHVTTVCLTAQRALHARAQVQEEIEEQAHLRLPSIKRRKSGRHRIAPGYMSYLRR